MYEQFYGLRERPFDLTPNPRYLVLTDGHREALSHLEYAIASRKGITLLLGEAGSGKTTVIRTAIERYASRVHCVHLHNPALTRAEFVEMLAARFDLSEQARRSKTTFLLELEALLRERHQARETTVLIVDEAQSLSSELLEEIRLLANIETNDEKLLTLIIAGQPELATQLDHDNLRQLKQRIALRCELQPLTMRETVAYLAGRIRAAGGSTARILTREAAIALHEGSGGIPRTINVLADNTLIAGYARGESPVNSKVVKEVIGDFRLGQPAMPFSEESGGGVLVMPSSTSGPVGLGAVAPPVPATASQPTGQGQGGRNSLFESFTGKGRRFAFFSRKGVA